MSEGHNVDQVDGYQQGLTFAMTRLGDNCDGVATAEQALNNYREELEMQYAATLKWDVVDVNLDKFSPEGRAEAERAMQTAAFHGVRVTPTNLLRNVCGQLVQVREDFEEFADKTGERIDRDVDRIRRLAYAVRFLRDIIRFQNDNNTVKAIESADPDGKPIDLDELLAECEPKYTNFVESPGLGPHDGPEPGSSSLEEDHLDEW